MIIPQRVIPALATHLPTPLATASLKLRPEDFVVDEVLGFEPKGQGEHVLLQIRKSGLNTQELAKRLAAFAGIAIQDVGYCGLKDKHALTSQWFSLRLAGKPEPDWRALEAADLALLQLAKHDRKLRRGAHRANRFCVLLSELQADRAELEQRLHQLAMQGVPNYFGPQRFGRDYRNLSGADQLFAGKRFPRHERSLYLSAMRAHLFNQVLSARITQGWWQQALVGDVMNLEGSNSLFVCQQVDEQIIQRLASGDIHISGPLCGRGQQRVSDSAALFEAEVLADFTTEIAALTKLGLEAGRRPLRVLLQGFSWQWLANGLQLTFSLRPGSFATSVVRELAQINDNESRSL